MEISDDVQVIINQEKIKEDEKWDGLKGYLTNTNFPGEEVYAQYNGLWVVERAYRITKGTIELRPMFHFTPKRIEAHVCICFVAYKVYKELERILKLSDINLSADKVLNIAKTVTTIKIRLPESGETVFTLNLKAAEKHIENLREARKDTANYAKNTITSAKQLSGFRQPSFSDKPVFTGRFQREDYSVEKYFLKGEGDYVLPFLLFVPEKPNHKAVIYLHSEGKEAEAQEGGEIEWLTRQGFTVLSPDLAGVGELGKGSLKGDAYIQNVSYNMWFTAMLAGRSIAGIQATDIIKLAHALNDFFSMEKIYGIACNALSPSLLHAAAFDPMISRVLLIKPYSSYRSVLVNRFYNPHFVYSLVPGALTKYDITDLAATLAPRKLTLAGVTDCNGLYEDSDNIDEDLTVIKNGYNIKGAANQLHIISPNDLENRDKLFQEWLK